MFTLQVPSTWSMLYIELVNLKIMNEDQADPILFARKSKLPSLDVYSTVPYQHQDTQAWSEQANTHKILLMKETSSLSDGLYYFGIYNTLYARGLLAYSLMVTGYEDDEDKACDNLGMCNGGGECSTQRGCICREEFYGSFCEFQAQHYVISAPDRNSTEIPSTTLSFHDHPKSVLLPGEAMYLSFELDNVDKVPLELEVDLELKYFRSYATNGTLNYGDRHAPQALLLLRGPDQIGFPTLDRDGLSSSTPLSISHNEHDNINSVKLPFRSSLKACTGQNCYKLGVYNRKFSSTPLTQYQLVFHFIWSSGSCTATTCSGHGECVVLHSKKSVCECDAGYTGYKCSSVKALDIPHFIQATAKSIPQLCRYVIKHFSVYIPIYTNLNTFFSTMPLTSTCTSEFDLSRARGIIQTFRIPPNFKSNTGFRIQLRERVQEGKLQERGPSIYLSEVLPRSAFDFVQGPSSFILNISRPSKTGNYWITVVNHQHQNNISHLNLSMFDTNEEERRRNLRELLLLSTSTYEIQMNLIHVDEDVQEIQTIASLFTKSSFLSSLGHWIRMNGYGLLISIISVLFYVIMASFCIWRTVYAPDNSNRNPEQLLKSVMSPAKAVGDDDGKEESKEEEIDDDRSIVLTVQNNSPI